MNCRDAEKLARFIGMLKTRIVEGGLTRAELAEQAGVDSSQVTRWLEGGQKPSGEAALRLWIAYGQPDSVDVERGTLPRDKPPYELWSVTAGENCVQIPSEARLLVAWLPCDPDNPTQDCIGVMNCEGGRRILPLDGPTQRKIANLEKSFEGTHSAKAKDFSSGRLSLARYLAASWKVTISYQPGDDYELRVTRPSEALPADSPVDVFALNGEILEVFTTPSKVTQLHEEQRRVAREFPRLLDEFSEP